MSEQQINSTQLLEVFQLMDKNNDGYISFNEFQSSCQKFHMPFDKKQFKHYFQHHHKISFEEFCRIIQDFNPQSPDAYFHETFRAFDRNSDGFITGKEIKKTMKELGESLTDKQIKDMIKTADRNGDGKLSKDEFRILFNYLTNLTESSRIVNEHNS